MRSAKVVLLVFSLSVATLTFAQDKPKITLDEFFNSVSFSSVKLSPDGNSVVIGTERADWDRQIFSKDLWLYRNDGANGSLVQLTQSGHDTEPQWSPDGKWIAFLSDRKSDTENADESDEDENKKDEGVDQIYLIDPRGGEAFAVTSGSEEVHAFSWSADSKSIYFATRDPWTKDQKDEYRKQCDWQPDQRCSDENQVKPVPSPARLIGRAFPCAADIVGHHHTGAPTMPRPASNGIAIYQINPSSRWAVGPYPCRCRRSQQRSPQRELRPKR
jgi:dipeptidyl aminopeptidase/acylaminoacyl peptidase